MSGLDDRRIIGVVPAAGKAERIAPLPCSKEVFPVGFIYDGTQPVSPKPVCRYLLEQFRVAGAERAIVVVGAGKWDVPATLLDGGAVGLRLAYLVIEDSPSAVATVTQAIPFVDDHLVLFGFPDIISQPADVYVQLLERQDRSGADVVLGLFVAEQPERFDMVDVTLEGTVKRIVVKPLRTDLTLTWISAVWTPSFTEFLGAGNGSRRPERHIGDVIQAAIEARYHVDSVIFDEGRYVDIGTPEDLASALQRYSVPDRGRPGTGNS